MHRRALLSIADHAPGGLRQRVIKVTESEQLLKDLWFLVGYAEAYAENVPDDLAAQEMGDVAARVRAALAGEGDNDEDANG
jgi:hypothetical protein